MKRFTSFFSLGILLMFSSYTPSTHLAWNKIDEGLFLLEYLSPQKSDIGDNLITILKIDPTLYDFNLFSAKEVGERIRTADQWAGDKGQIAIINAGMYQADFATNVGFMQDYDFVNQARLNKDNTIAAFNPKDASVPPFQIIDRTCQDWEEMKMKYHSYTQSIRMMDCQQKNRWGKQAKKWSMVVIGADEKGNALFMFSRSPYSVHDFINILRKAPIELYNLMYLEGGPEASFYLHHAGTHIARMGSYETGFNENDDNKRFWQIPNVIGVRKK